jgi:hypothetical protein
MDFVLIVNGNPDGRDLHRRVNANGVNLSTDYALLSQPESRAVAAILQRFKPHVVLDVHESALLKKSTLGAQGFLTDFEAQFEITNNPNVEPALQAFSREHFLPALLEAVNARDLPARHYIGEITDVNQPITHGGLSLRNLRNYAGMQTALSVLVENRLDPPGEYPTPRNIAVRVAKQFLCIATFLAQCQRNQAAILERVTAARHGQHRQDADPVLHLAVAYARDPRQSQITLPLHRRDTGELVRWTFDYHLRIVANEPLSEPLAYLVTDHQIHIAELLDRHGIPYTWIKQPSQRYGTRQLIESVHLVPQLNRTPRVKVRVSERTQAIQLAPGDLQVDLDSSAARLVPLLLDPRSSSSVFQTPAFSELLVEGADFFIVRVERVKKPEASS